MDPMSQPTECSWVRCSTRVGSGLLDAPSFAYKYWTRVKVTDNDKHFSFLGAVKKF
jgi:hypothetical protein